MKILQRRRSRRNPEVEYVIVRQDNGEIICNCPACEHGGRCYERMKIQSNEDLLAQRKVKFEISNHKLPDMKVLREQQWAYINKRDLEWLRKYPEDATLPQYQKLAARHGIKSPVKVLEERERALRMHRFLTTGRKLKLD